MPALARYSQPRHDGRGPVIGDRVWIGAHAQIIGPYRVGSDATVGAATVVQSDIPDGVLCLGNPSRLVKRNYDNRPMLGLSDRNADSPSRPRAAAMLRPR